MASGIEEKLLEAARYGSLGAVKFFLKKDVNINVQGAGGNTCLHWAVLQKKVELVEVLLKHGCNPNLVNEKGDYPIHIAVELQDLETQRILMKYKADITTKGSKGLTAIELRKLYIKASGR